MSEVKITAVMMDDSTIDVKKEVDMVFSIANTLRGPYKPDKYKDVIIPMIILQKRFTVDFLQKKIKVNEGEVPQYYVANSHPAIVAPEYFDQVQEEMARRKRLGRSYRSGSIFSCRLVCGDCGEFFGPKVWNSTDKYRRVVWQCNAKFKGELRCATPHLTEEAIKEKFIQAYNQLIPDRERLIEDCRIMRDTLCDCTELNQEIDGALQETEVLAEMVQRGVEENSRVAQDQDDYNKRYAGLLQRYEAASAKMAVLQKKRSERQKKAEAIGRFIKRLSEREEPLREFTAGLWIDSIETVVVQADGSMAFRFQGGSEVAV